jgi:hypothetical protein
MARTYLRSPAPAARDGRVTRYDSAAQPGTGGWSTSCAR